MMEASDNLRQWGLQRARAEEVGGGKRWAAEGVEWGKERLQEQLRLIAFGFGCCYAHRSPRVAVIRIGAVCPATFSCRWTRSATSTS